MARVDAHEELVRRTFVPARPVEPDQTADAARPDAHRRFDRFSRAFVRNTTTQFDDYPADEVARNAKQVGPLEDLAEMTCRERRVQLAEAAGGY